LEILPAMKPGAQNEVAVEERAGLTKKCEKVFAHLGSAGILPALLGMLPDSFNHAFLGKSPAECR